MVLVGQGRGGPGAGHWISRRGGQCDLEKQGFGEEEVGKERDTDRGGLTAPGVLEEAGLLEGVWPQDEEFKMEGVLACLQAVMLYH